METSLSTNWNEIEVAIANLSNADVATLTKDDAVDMGKMDHSLEAVKSWAKDSKQKLEIQNNIAKSKLILNRKQGEWIELNIPEDGGNPQLAQNGRLTLSQVSIDKHDSPKFRTLARMPQAKLYEYINKHKNEVEITLNDACRLWSNTIATKWTGDQENYTPAEYIEAAREVMGSIDLDPASNDIAQKTVKAATYYTKENDGLTQPWNGNIFLNPPYSHPEVANFVDKLLNELNNGQQAILLTNNNTDTIFFHKAAKIASVLCFTKGRISFYKDDGQTRTSPTNGQVFYYFGNNKDRFIQCFSQFGIIMEAL